MLDKINTTTVISVVAGIAAFGTLIYVIKKLPSGNFVTEAAQKAADIIQGGK